MVELINGEMDYQEDQINNIRQKVKIGTDDIIGLKKKIEDDKKDIIDGTKYIETADSKIIKLNNRLVKYLANSGNWCLRISLIVEIVIAVALIIVFTKV